MQSMTKLQTKIPYDQAPQWKCESLPVQTLPSRNCHQLTWWDFDTKKVWQLALVQKVTIGAYFGQFQLKDDIDSVKLGGCQLIHAKKYLRWIDNVIVMKVLRWRKMKTQATGFFIMVMMTVFMVTMTMWWWQWHWWRLWRWFWRWWWWCWRILRRVRLGYKQRGSSFRSTPSLFIRRQTAKHDHLSWQAIIDDQGDCHIWKVLMIRRKQGCSSICAKSLKIAQVVTSHAFFVSIL